MVGDSGKKNLDVSPSITFLHSGMEVQKYARHLPHWQIGGVFCFLTWRLADALPQALLKSWWKERADWLKCHPRPWDPMTQEEYQQRFPRRVECWLDAGYGACYLRDPECALLVGGALHYFDGERYDLAAYCVMPNHVHVLFQLREGYQLRMVTQSWKGYSARKINQRLGRTGTLWQDESWDHLLRGLAHLDRCLSYIRENPVRAGLAAHEFLLYEAPEFRETVGLDGVDRSE